MPKQPPKKSQMAGPFNQQILAQNCEDHRDDAPREVTGLEMVEKEMFRASGKPRTNQNMPRSQTHIVTWARRKPAEERGRMPKQPPKQCKISGIFNSGSLS
jgi:hypothetical protein